MSVRHTNAPDVETHQIDAGTITAAMLAAGVAPLQASAYGELIIGSSAASLALTVQGTWYPVVSNWSSNEVSGVTLTPAAGTMTIVSAGVYQTACVINFTSPSAPNTVQFGIFKGNSLIADHLAISWLDTTTYPNNVAITGIVSLAVGDVISLRARCTTAAGTSVVPTDVNFSVLSLAGAPYKLCSVVHATPVGGGYVSQFMFNDSATTGGLYAWTGIDYTKVGLATS